MPRRPDRSPQTLAVLDALVAAGTDDWSYGYDLSGRTGLPSGTLYPILARLADRGLAERRWEDPAPQGRPARHLYRVTAAGEELLREVAREARAAAQAGATREAARGSAPARQALTPRPSTS